MPNAARLPSVRTISALPAISLVTVGVATLNSVFIARLIGPEGQASYASIVAFNAVVALVIGCGTGTTLRLKGERATRDDRIRYVGYSLAAAGVGFAIAVAWFILGVSSSDGGLVVVLAGMHCALMVLNAQASEFNQLDSRIILAVSSVFVSQLITVAGIVPLYLGAARDINSVLFVVVLGLLGQLLFQFRGWRILWPAVVFSPKFPAHFRLAVEGAPVVSNLVIIAFLQRGNRMIVPLVASGHIAGLVAAIAVVAEILRLIPNSLGQGIFLRVTGLKRFDRVSFFIAALGFFTTLALSGVLLVFGEQIVFVLFGEQYTGASQYILPLLVAELGISVLVIAYRVCLGLGGGRALAVSFLVLAAAMALGLLVAVVFASVWGVLWVFAGACLVAAGLAVVVSFCVN